MKKICAFLPGNWFSRTTVSVGSDGKAVIKISADPHDYQKSFCMKIRYANHDADWLLGNSYVKFRIWLDGKFVGCGPFRSLVNKKRVEHTFEVADLAPGEHTLAIASRCDFQGLNVEVNGSACNNFKVFDSNNYQSPICWEFPAVYGRYKGDCGPGEYFENLRGDLYPDNWQSPVFDDSNWQIPEFRTIECEVESAPFNFEYETIRPVSIRRCADGRFIADFGEERIAGLMLTGPKNGGNMEVRLGEELLDSERVRYEMRCSACYHEIWKFRPGKQTLSHFGLRAFRYAEIVGYDEELLPQNIAMQVVRAPYKPAAELKCGNENLLKIWKLCENTIRNITCDTFVDCFTRERIAYEADAVLALGSFFSFNQNHFIVRNHLTYQLNHPTWPCEWSLMIPILFYEYYMETGDKSVVRENFDQLLAYSGYLDRIKDGMVEKFDLDPLIDWPMIYKKNFDLGDNRFLSVLNMLLCNSLRLLSLLADAIGQNQLAAKLDQQYETVKRTINERCFAPETGLYIDRPGSSNSSLYANMWALYTGIVPPEQQQKVVDFVVQYGMKCGLYSAYWYLDVLFRYGHGKAAFEYIAADDSRWMDMINSGCTATSEHWINDVPRMSLAHPWGCYPAHFITRYVFGIRPTAPGWSSYEIEPDNSIDFHGGLQLIRNGVKIVTQR